MSNPNPFRLHVLGAPDLRGPDGRRVTSVLSQPKRLGLLTYLALAEGPVARATLVALFWPESDEGRARNALSQAVFHLRRSLDERVVESVEGDRLWAPPEHLWCDAREVLAGRAIEGALDAAPGAGPGRAQRELLEGWNADDSQELQEWLDARRRRLQARTNVASQPAATRATVPDAVRLPGAASTPDARRPRAARLLAPAAVAALVGLALAVALLGRGPTASADAQAGSLAVLLPQITSAPGAPQIDPAAVHAEILSALPHVEGVRIVSAAYASSLQELRRQLDALGVEAGELPRWILEVSVRVTGAEARAVGLLHRAPAYDLPGRTSFDVSYASAEAALLEAPQEVARGVSAMVGDVLAIEGR